MTTTKPTLLACLRAIAESGRTERVKIKNDAHGALIKLWPWTGKPERKEWTLWRDTPAFNDEPTLVEMAYCLVQVAISQGISLKLIYADDGSSGVIFDASEPKYYGVGMDGIESMSHALAFGICQSLGIEVTSEPI